MRYLKTLFTDAAQRLFYDRDSTAMLLLLAGLCILLFTLGDTLLPVLVAFAVAYVLLGPTHRLTKVGVPRVLSVVVAFSLGLIVFIGLLLLLPLASREMASLLTELPNIVLQAMVQAEDLASTIEDDRTRAIVYERLEDLRVMLSSNVTGGDLGPWLTFGFRSLVGFGTVVLYLIVVPVLVFLIMHEAPRIGEYIGRIVPYNNPLQTTIWDQTDRLLSNYIRGKFVEMLLVFAAAAGLLYYFELRFALLLSAAIGLSVLVPIVGATVVTVPVMAVALVQFGVSEQALYVFVGYVILQLLDGYLLVPLLFSQAMRVSPLVILLAVVVFGNLFGFWGAFFAVPLATFVGLLIKVWQTPSRHEGIEDQTQEVGPLPLVSERPDLSVATSESVDIDIGQGRVPPQIQDTEATEKGKKPKPPSS